MKIVRNCLVLFLLVTLLVQVICTSEYCLFHGVEYNRADCRPNTVNHTFISIPVITRSITHIDLAGQPLKHLPYNAFRNISNQKEFSHMNLGHCEIDRISADAFLNLDNLKDLSLAFNKITKFETSTFLHMKKLTYLLASYNQIDTLQAGLFSNLVYLKRISFIHNHITHIDKDTFRNTPALVYINLRHNKMNYLDPLFKDNFRKVNHLYLGGNPWNCDCNLKEVFKIYKVHRPRDEHGEPTCENPLTLRDIDWFYLTSDAFICDPRIILPTNDTRIVSAGSSVTLSCAVYGDPKPDIIWSKDSMVIPQDNINTSSHMNIHYLNYTFTVQEEDLGVYQCIANNTRELRKSSTTLFRDVSQSTVTIPTTVESIAATTVAVPQTIELIPTQRKSMSRNKEDLATQIEPISATTDRIPITTDSALITTERISITTDNIPETTDYIPITTDRIPITTDYIPITTDRIPETTDYIPITTDRISITTDRISITTDRISITNDRIPITTDYASITTDSIPTTTDSIPTTDRTPKTIDTGSTIQEFASTIEINEPLITIKESATAIREVSSETTESAPVTTVEVKMNVVLQLPTNISWQENVHIKPLRIVQRTNQTSANGESSTNEGNAQPSGP